MQEFFFAMMLKSRSYSIAGLQERGFLHFLSALAVTPTQTLRPSPSNRLFPYFKIENTTSEAILQEFFLI
jgi:hypothetical protein